MKRTTVKEIRRWMKGLEENRYRRLVNADARRVAWFVNNQMSEDYETMPKTLRKKWTEAKYGKERYLATEYLKKLQESRLRSIVKDIIKEVMSETTKKAAE
jgi:hypothetical protein